MMPQYSTVMRDAISNVLETMFFLVPAFKENENLKDSQPNPFFLDSSVTITGERQHFRLLIRATRAFVTIITANFLGVGQEEVVVEEMEDTLKELANMVGGDCLSRLPPDNWKLGIPKLEQPTSNPDECSTSSVYSIILSLDEEPVAQVQLFNGC
jgi:hypothetical protein